MKAITYSASMLAVAYMLAGCAKEPPQGPIVATATVSVTASDFCEIMQRLYPTGKPTWSLADTPDTITQIRRLGAAFDKRCVPPRPATPKTS